MLNHCGVKELADGLIKGMGVVTIKCAALIQCNLEQIKKVIVFPEECGKEGVLVLCK